MSFFYDYETVEGAQHGQELWLLRDSAAAACSSFGSRALICIFKQACDDNKRKHAPKPNCRPFLGCPTVYSARCCSFFQFIMSSINNKNFSAPGPFCMIGERICGYFSTLKTKHTEFSSQFCLWLHSAWQRDDY